MKNKLWLIIVDDATGGCGRMGDAGSQSNVMGYFYAKTKKDALKFINQEGKKGYKESIKYATEANDKFWMNKKYSKEKDIKVGDYLYGYSYGHNPRRNYKITIAEGV